MAVSTEVTLPEDTDNKISKISRNVDKNLLDLFWNLAETNRDVRVKAFINIKVILLRKQKEFKNQDNGEKCPELEYTIERLVKGMGSSRKAARQGYSLSLSKLLKTFPVITIEEVLQLLEKHLPVSNKQEKCDMIFGQMLTFSAVVKSQRLKEDSYLSLVVLKLHKLSVGRSYLHNGCYKMMSNLFSQITKEQFKDSVWPHFQKELCDGWEKCQPDTLAYLLLCIRTFPGAISPKFLKKHWGDQDLLCADNFCHIKRLIKQSTAVHPLFHPVCSEVLAFILQKKDLKEAWNAIVDDNLFESDQNEKTYLGIKIVQEALSKTQKKKVVKCIMSPKFCSVFSRSFLNMKHPLNLVASDLATFLCQYVDDTKDPHIQIIILKAFLQPSGTILLEQVLKRKKVVLIISHLCPEAVKSFFEMLKSIVLQKKEDSSADDADDESEGQKYQQAIVQIGTLISHPATIADIEWRMDVLKFLFLHSFFTVSETSTEATQVVHNAMLSNAERQACIISFTRALDSLNRKIDTPTSQIQQLLQLLQCITDYADQLLQSEESFKPLVPTEKIQDSWKKMKNMVLKLNKQSKKDGKTNESNAFQILFLQLGLQLFLDSEHTPGVIEELQICCKKALKHRKHQEDMEEESDMAGPPWVQVVIDVMLSLLSQPSHHMRCVVVTMFRLICPFITSDALLQILDVINPEKAVDEDPLVEDAEVDGEEEMDFESGSSSEEENASNEENEDENENVDQDFKLKIEKALGPALEVSDAESETILSDSEMFKLDEALSEAFRSRKNAGNSKLNTEQKTLLHFRTRCLDLIMIYLKTEPPMYMVMQCLFPVLSAYEFGKQSRHQHPLSIKALSTLKMLSKLRKFQHCREIQKSELEDFLEQLIVKAHKESNSDVGRILNCLCLFMVLCERKLESLENAEKGEQESGCLKKYFSALEGFLKKSNSRILPQMFISLMNACPEMAYYFLQPLEEHAFDLKIRVFKRSQCLGLILSALQFSKAQKSVTAEMWLQFSRSLIPKIILALKSVSSDIKPVYSTELLDVLITMETLVKQKTDVSVLQEHKELVSILTDMNSTESKKLTNKGNCLRKRLSIMLGEKLPDEQTPKGKKRKRDHKQD